MKESAQKNEWMGVKSENDSLLKVIQWMKERNDHELTNKLISYLQLLTNQLFTTTQRSVSLSHHLDTFMHG